MGKIRRPDSLFTEVIGILEGIFIIIEMTAERGRFSYTGIREGREGERGRRLFGNQFTGRQEVETEHILNEDQYGTGTKNAKDPDPARGNTLHGRASLKRRKR